MKTKKKLVLCIFTVLATIISFSGVQAAFPNTVSADIYTSGKLEWSHFNPSVVSYDYTGTVDLLCRPTGSFTEVRFKPCGTNVEIPLTDRGSGIYGITLNAGDIIAGLTNDDVNRKCAGDLLVYNGSTVDIAYSKLLNVLTPDVPLVNPVQLADNVQVTPHLFNMESTNYQDAIKKFYEYYGDNYDFINIVWDQNFYQPASCSVVSNDVQNIGLPIMDNTASYGSAGRLKAILKFPKGEIFDGAAEVQSHEIGHTWINYLDFYPLYGASKHPPVGTLGTYIMSSERGHLNLTFSQTGPDSWELGYKDRYSNVFSDLSLYLMGLIPSTEVGTHMIFENQDQPIGIGETWVGPVIYIDGSDVVANMGGERVPNYQDSQKEFKIATILMTEGSLASSEMMQLYDWLASRASLDTPATVHQMCTPNTQNPFYVATGGRATLDPALGVIVGNEPPVADAGPDQTVERTSVDGSEVALDGSGSSDPNSDPLTYIWTWPGESASGVNPTVTMPMGNTTVTLEVSDGEYSDTDTVVITVLETTSPVVAIEVPVVDAALQDGVTLTATTSDLSGIQGVSFFIREPDGGTGIPIGHEDLPATYNAGTDKWECVFDTTLLPDGHYVVLAKAINSSDNEGWSDVVPFSVSNWAVLELLPASKNNKAGRTMPIKFSLRVAEAVDPDQPFVYNEELEIRIYDTSDLSNVLQTSVMGDSSKSYRINTDGELYITNFKTTKKPAEYMVEIWRFNSSDFLVCSFTFETVK